MPDAPVRVTGIVLAGGRASRMHGEKPLRLLRGKSLLQHAMDQLRPVTDDVVVASASRDLGADVTCVDDGEFQGDGPLAGILGGLDHAAEHGSTVALALACDLPNLPSALLRELLNGVSGDKALAFCTFGDHPEPLVAALRVAPARAAIRDALADGQRKVMHVWRKLERTVLNESDIRAHGDPKRLFANLNTLEELEQEARSGR